MSGSVQRIENRVRVNVQLLDGTRGLNLWGQRYDRELEDVFQVQDEITATVVSTLAGRVEATHLARALLHLERFDEALRVFDNIGRPRIDDLAYSVVASMKISELPNIKRTADALYIAFPEFDAASFVDGLPYERTQDRDLVLCALESANLGTANQGSVLPHLDEWTLCSIWQNLEI